VPHDCFAMKVPTYVHDTALPQNQQGSSVVTPNPASSQASPEEGALRYLCSPCHTSYVQPQGLGRHIRTVHNPNLCFRCEFRWGRPYEYRNHLQKKHPDVDPDTILGKALGSRRRATILTEYLPQQPSVSLPAVEQGQQNRTESQPNPLAPPSESPAPAGVTSVSPPTGSSGDYNSQPFYAEQTVTMEEHAEPMNDLDISFQGGQFELEQSFFT
jgi:hypothetical protein